MNSRWFLKILLIFFVVFFASACEASKPLETEISVDIVDQTMPNEVLRVSGDGDYVSESFVLEGQGMIELFWEQECQEFYLQLINSNESLAQAPGGTVIFEAAASPSANTEADDIDMAYAFIPGEYVIKINAKGGLWEVWAVVTYSDAE